MNHKLRVLVRVDVDPGHVTLEVTGCLTQSDFPALLHIMRRAGRLGAGSDVIIDLHGSSHLDPEILLQLRSIAGASAAAPGTDAGSPGGTAPGKVPFRITLEEPADLPICLMHVGSDGEVLAGLEGELAAAPLPDAGAAPLAVGGEGVSPGPPSGLPQAFPPVLPLAFPLGGSWIRGWTRPAARSLPRSTPSTAWRSPNTSKGPSTPPPPSGHCPTWHWANWPMPCTGTLTPAARLSARTPGTSWPPKSCRTGTWAAGAIPRRANWLPVRPLPEPSAIRLSP